MKTLHYKGYYCYNRKGKWKVVKVDKSVKVKNKEQENYFKEFVKSTKTKAIDYRLKDEQQIVKRVKRFINFIVQNDYHITTNVHSLKTLFNKNLDYIVERQKNIKALNKLKNSLRG